MSPLQMALSGLRSLVDFISDPVQLSPIPAFDRAGTAREVLTRAWGVAGELVRAPSGALREAVTLSSLLDGMLLSVIPRIVTDFSSGPPSDAEIKSALSACLLPLQEKITRATQQLDAHRAFDVFDTGKSTRPSLDLFLSR
jgi:hypothetical protein